MENSDIILKQLDALVNTLKASLKQDMTFPPGSVPVSFAAKVYGKDPCWIRAGIISGWLPIGKATRDGKEILDVQDMDSKKGRISYYISPKLLYEQTGIAWKGEK